MRTVYDLNENWEFLFNESDISSRGGEKINIPHTYNAIDGQDGGGDYFKGQCVYKKTLAFLPESGKRYFLDFAGVSASAKVYIDKKFVGSHDGGYSTFRFDVTEYLSGTNELAVIVDNGVSDRVYPQNADFTFYGGIYRDVKMIKTSENHFDLEYYGGRGVFVTPTLKEDGSAEINVKSFVTGRGDVEVYFAGNNATGLVAKGKDASVIIQNPHLWDGRADPYLYVATAVLLIDGKSVDEVSVKFGIRSFYVDKDEGFFLNGRSCPLRGVAIHQDRFGKGNAISPSDIKEDIDLVYETGANTVRLAHYQHSQKTYELCDERGLAVWAEIPYISEHLDNASENALLQMKELIIQNYNHPSIFFWGLSNEITMAHGDNPNILPLHIKLNELCHSMDKTRLTTMACISKLPTSSPLLDVPDVLSYNHYFGWYGGQISDNGEWFDAFHKLHPDMPIGMSEYGAENALWHSSHPEPGDYSNEYQMKYHESMIEQLFARKYLFATHVWNMFDFGADMRDEGGTHGRNNKGLVTFDRKIKKDPFFAYKARLSKEKVLHLCSKEYVNREGDKTEFVVYSNLSEVSLYVNGKLEETKSEKSCFYHFEIVQPSGEYVVETKSEDLSEKATFKHVEKFDESYTFGGATVLNWFDIKTPDGYFSVKDLVKDMQCSEEAFELGKEFIKTLKNHLEEERKKKEKELGRKIVKGGNGMSEEESLKTTMDFSPLQLVKMGWPNMPKEDIIAFNEKLNQIKKP